MRASLGVTQIVKNIVGDLSMYKMLKAKAGKLGTGMVNQAIIGIVLLVVLFQLYATLVPEAQTAGDALNATGVPFGSLFTSGGVVFIIIMAALVLVVIRSFMSARK